MSQHVAVLLVLPIAQDATHRDAMGRSSGQTGHGLLTCTPCAAANLPSLPNQIVCCCVQPAKGYLIAASRCLVPRLRDVYIIYRQGCFRGGVGVLTWAAGSRQANLQNSL